MTPEDCRTSEGVRDCCYNSFVSADQLEPVLTDETVRTDILRLLAEHASARHRCLLVSNQDNGSIGDDFAVQMQIKGVANLIAECEPDCVNSVIERLSLLVDHHEDASKILCGIRLSSDKYIELCSRSVKFFRFFVSQLLCEQNMVDRELHIEALRNNARTKGIARVIWPL